VLTVASGIYILAWLAENFVGLFLVALVAGVIVVVRGWALRGGR
jgi:hypothetical protein